MSGFLRMLALASVGYTLYLALLYTQQRAMMFPGPDMGIPALSQATLPAGASRVSLAASFGEVQAILLHAEDARLGRPAALYFHGNAESVAQNLDALRAIARRGVHVLLVEYPGYAGTDGRPTRESLVEAAQLAHGFLATNPLIDPQRIIAVGRSIGSGPALELSRSHRLAAIVLLSAFSELDGFAHSMGAPAWLIRDRFDNAAALAGFDGPTLLFHGRRDAIIPAEHSRRLHAVAQAATLVELDCGHNDCPFFQPGFVDALMQFLDAHGLLSGTHE